MLKNIASFVLSGKLQAFSVVFGFLIFALAFPLSAIVSGAALVLLTLHTGPKNSLLIVFTTTIALAICSQLIIGNAPIGALTAVVQLTPSLILATLLYSTRSLSLSLQASALLGALAFVIINAIYPDATQFWQSVLTPILTPALEARNYAEENITALISQTANYMTGLLIASIVLVHSCILLFGYKLYCLTIDSQQFDIDFKQIRLSKVLAILVFVLGLLAFMTQSTYAAQLCGILAILYFLQGMAVIHTTCGTMTKGKLWLIITYLLVIFIPQAIAVVILLGLFDTFFKLRPREQ